MPPPPPRRRRARAVADAPLPPLLARVDDLAKGWLLALVEQSPLDRASAILDPAFAVDGPRICDAVVRALAGEQALARLQPGGALSGLAARAGALTGSHDAEAVSHAVDALQAVVWSALCDELRGPDADLVAQLSDRLTHVCAAVRGAALAPNLAADLAEAPAGVPAASGAGGSIPAPAGPSPLSVPPPPAGPAAGRAAPGGPVPSPSAAAQPLWVAALEDEIGVAGTRPLALLLVELDDAERLARARPEADASVAFGQFAQAVRGALAGREILVAESEARAWIIAPGGDRADAHAAGERIADAVAAASSWGGAPLLATVGVAVLGEDGGSAAELIEAAEEARFAASARGIVVSRRGDA